MLNDVKKSKDKDISLYKGVWVLAEQRDSQLLSVSQELVSEGRKLANELAVELTAVLLGVKLKEIAKELVAYGADRVIMVENQGLKQYRTGSYARVVADLINQYKPEIVLFGATHNGRDLAPRLSARLQTGLTADCTKLEIDSEKKILLQTRPAFGGNLMATIICPEHRPQMSTVRPGVMVKAEADYSRQGNLVEISANLGEDDIMTINKGKPQIIKMDAQLSEGDSFTKIINTVKAASKAIKLEEAEIIIAGGRGVGSSDGFEVIKELAVTLGGEVGASRAVVDEGWIDKEHQVGQTGKTVHPKLYLACGISGAIQHRAGMQESDIIIAVNTDAAAPIFEVCDYGIVGDLHEIVPLLNKAFQTVEVV